MLDSFKSRLASLRRENKLAKILTRPFGTLRKITGGNKFTRPDKSSFHCLELDSSVSKQLRQVFNFIDTDGDGKISPSELSQLLLSLGHDKDSAAQEAERMVKQLDDNGNGFIDLEEFMEVFWTKHHDKMCYWGDTTEEGECLMDVFRIFDSDQNGLISAQELRRVLTSLGFDNCSMQDCKRMIRGVDKDGDGFVDFEEFRLMMTGSTPTLTEEPPDC